MPAILIYRLIGGLNKETIPLFGDVNLSELRMKKNEAKKVLVPVDKQRFKDFEFVFDNGTEKP